MVEIVRLRIRIQKLLKILQRCEGIFSQFGLYKATEWRVLMKIYTDVSLNKEVSINMNVKKRSVL